MRGSERLASFRVDRPVRSHRHMTTTPQPALNQLPAPLAPAADQLVPEADEDPHSPGPIPFPPQTAVANAGHGDAHDADGGPQSDDWSNALGLLTGGAIAMVTLVVPLLSVISDRGAAPPQVRNNSPLLLLQPDGPSPSPRLSGTGSGEPGGGDSGR